MTFLVVLRLFLKPGETESKLGVGGSFPMQVIRNFTHNVRRICENNQFSCTTIAFKELQNPKHSQHGHKIEQIFAKCKLNYFFRAI